ncbi:hypothetical protein WJX72_000978 [[Myrmecia] bisecta]|uniref:DNA-directed RNA polymerases I and III subunit RPAC2 n=1 Tax=[Myrmecia] bisecta TaxID=41462 RepID=A0AAW1QE50_9CHLO
MTQERKAPLPKSETSLTYAIEDEDHTLGNSLRFLLNKNPHVDFVGYSIGHPSEHRVQFRIQTTGEITATEALRQACRDLKQICAHMKQTMAEEVERVKSGAADMQS